MTEFEIIKSHRLYNEAIVEIRKRYSFRSNNMSYCFKKEELPDKYKDIALKSGDDFIVNIKEAEGEEAAISAAIDHCIKNSWLGNMLIGYYIGRGEWK